MKFEEWEKIVGAKDPRYDSMVVDIIADWKADREAWADILLRRAEKAEAYAKELEAKLDENRDEYIEQARAAEDELEAKRLLAQIREHELLTEIDDLRERLRYVFTDHEWLDKYESARGLEHVVNTKNRFVVNMNDEETKIERFEIQLKAGHRKREVIEIIGSCEETAEIEIPALDDPDDKIYLMLSFKEENGGKE